MSLRLTSFRDLDPESQKIFRALDSLCPRCRRINSPTAESCRCDPNNGDKQW